MMPMDAKGITWVGNIYQKFENMCLEEVEDTVFEETVEYIENQMQIVGESVKKLYSDVILDLLPPSSCDLGETASPGIEVPIDQYAEAGFCKKSFQGSKKVTVKDDTEQATKDSNINLEVDNDAIFAEFCDTDTNTLFTSDSGNLIKGNNFISHARQYAGRKDINSNLDSDENQQNEKMPAVDEITSSETDTCSTSQSCEICDVNQNHEASVSNPASAEVTTLASVADHCNEIENVCTEQTPGVLVLVKSAEVKQMNMSSTSSVFFEDPYGFSMVRTMQPDDCSSDPIIVYHPEIRETWSLDIANVDNVREQGHKTTQLDDELKLEETCVMVTRDELQLVPKERVNLKTSKDKRQLHFSLSKKSARKQEYEQLAIWHANNENGKDDFVESICPTLLEDQKKLLLPDISEPEWELL